MSEEIEVQEKIEFDDLKFLRFRPSPSFNPDILEDYDAVIMEYLDSHNVLEAIHKIRSHNEKLVYITPIFLLNEGGYMKDSIIEMVDGVIPNIMNLDYAAATTRKIISRL
ncbi:MAG: hypothetical protein RI575_02630 [Balneolaceae bacterium]|nr:hypothetical protein [Balneolaceae bacterium]MDR9407599.1 hypothetical protein [Balneolaceae bacterium]